MYCYVNFSPQIGYTICCLSQFSTCPSPTHYNFPKGLAIYLKQAKHRGIWYHEESPTNHNTPLPAGDFKYSPPPLSDSCLPLPKTPTSPNPICLVNTAYVNDLFKKCSTTGYAIVLTDGVIAYRSKIQSVTALSSNEAKLYASVFDLKACFFLWHVLCYIGCPPSGLINIDEYNGACISVVNVRHPTDWTCHIETLCFHIQDWKYQDVIKFNYIIGVINASDDLSKLLE